MRGVRQTALAAGALLLIAALGCRHQVQTPVIGFVYPADRAGNTVARVAQAVIDSWQTPRLAEIAIPQLTSTRASELSRNVDFADRILGIGALSGVAGHLGSRTTLLVTPMYDQARTPLVVPTSTSRRLSTSGPWVFPLAPSEEAEGEFLVSFAVSRLGMRHPMVVYLSADEYGTGLRDAIVRALRRRELSPVDQIGVLGDSDIDRLLSSALARVTPDGFIVALNGNTARRLLVSLHSRMPGVPVAAGDGVVLTPAFLKDSAHMCRNLYTASFWHPDVARQESKVFVDRCRQADASVSPSSTDAMFYDSLMLLATAVKEVGADRDRVREYLASLGVSRPVLNGVSGPLSFHVGRPANIVMTRFLDGAVVVAGER